jgi:hypothetical protein
MAQPNFYLCYYIALWKELSGIFEAPKVFTDVTEEYVTMQGGGACERAQQQEPAVGVFNELNNIAAV